MWFIDVLLPIVLIFLLTIPVVYTIYVAKKTYTCKNTPASVYERAVRWWQDIESNDRDIQQYQIDIRKWQAFVDAIPDRKNGLRDV